MYINRKHDKCTRVFHTLELVLINTCFLLFVICIAIGSNYQEEEDWDPINRFNPVIYLCLSQAKACISNAIYGACHGRDRMLVGFTTTCAVSVYHH